MNKNDEKLIEDFLENKKNISIDSKKRYWVSLKSFQEFIEKGLIEFIDETKKKQINYMEETEIINDFGKKETVNGFIERDIENGELAKIFKDFYSSKSGKLSNVTINSYISDVRAFLKKQGVKLPENLGISTFTNPKKILKQEKIKRAIEKTPHLRNKAMFAFMASSGLRSKDVRNLKIKDFLKAVQIRNIKDLLLNQDNLIGYWEFKPSKTKKRKFNQKIKAEQGYVCKTCNTPHATRLIIKYLIKRSENEDLTPKSPLFATLTTKKKMGRQSVIVLFNRLNKELYNDDLAWFKIQLDLGKITEEEYNEEINDISKLHAHGLRAFFIDTISSHCNNLKIVATMEGHKSPVDTDSSYTNFKREIIENHYFPIIPYLSFEETKVNSIGKELEEKYEKKIEKLGKEHKKNIEKVSKIAEEASEKAEKFILEFEERYKSAIVSTDMEENHQYYLMAIYDDEKCCYVLNEIEEENPKINIEDNHRVVESIYKIINEENYLNLSAKELKKEINNLIDKFILNKPKLSDF